MASIDEARPSVITLAAMIGQFPSMIPYVSQTAMPVVNKEYISSEIDLVWRVRKVRMACGTKETVVRKAARYPVSSVIEMVSMR